MGISEPEYVDNNVGDHDYDVIEPVQSSDSTELEKHEELGKVHDLSTANAVIILIFMVLVLVGCCIVFGLIYYHYSNRVKRWIKITKTMHQRLSKQILLDEKLKELCQKIGVSGEVINADRKELCPDIEEMIDLPAARYVDPFRAPSNMYEQVNEKDDSAKTLKNNGPDVFLNKDDGAKSSGAGNSTTGKTKDTPGTTTPAPTKPEATPAPAKPEATPAAGGGAPLGTPASAEEGRAGQQQQQKSSEPPKPEEKKNPDKCDKPPEVIKSAQA
uniref:Uncharacterized protein n=1 Tax=Panagrolaimus sp. PS1159 TaxID=55785 RepID=A0AC35FCP2_9BILA